MKPLAALLFFCALQLNSAHKDSYKEIFMAKGLTETSISINEQALKRQMHALKNNVAFVKAVSQAIDSFLNDTSDLESPLCIADKDRKKLIDSMNNKSTSFCLVTKAHYNNSPLRPAHGEKLRNYWIFSLYIPQLSDHLYWAFIDRGGKKPPYNYGFN